MSTNYDPRWDVKMAVEFKNRNNPKMIGHVIGTVVEVSPLKVSVLDGGAFFSGENLTIGDKLKGYEEPATITIGDNTYTAIIHHNGLQINNKLICQFTQNNQQLIVIDKVS